MCAIPFTGNDRDQVEFNANPWSNILLTDRLKPDSDLRFLNMEGPTQGSTPDNLDQALLRVLKAMRNAGIANVGTFLTTFLASEHPGIQRQVDQFLRESFDDIMVQLMDRSYYGPTRRRTAKQTESTNAAFGERLINWVVKILIKEMKEAAGDSRAKLSPTNVCLSNTL